MNFYNILRDCGFPKNQAVEMAVDNYSIVRSGCAFSTIISATMVPFWFLGLFSSNTLLIVCFSSLFAGWSLGFIIKNFLRWKSKDSPFQTTRLQDQQATDGIFWTIDNLVRIAELNKNPSVKGYAVELRKRFEDCLRLLPVSTALAIKKVESGLPTYFPTSSLQAFEQLQQLGRAIDRLEALLIAQRELRLEEEVRVGELAEQASMSLLQEDLQGVPVENTSRVAGQRRVR